MSWEKCLCCLIGWVLSDQFQSLPIETLGTQLWNKWVCSLTVDYIILQVYRCILKKTVSVNTQLQNYSIKKNKMIWVDIISSPTPLETITQTSDGFYFPMYTWYKNLKGLSVICESIVPKQV